MKDAVRWSGMLALALALVTEPAWAEGFFRPVVVTQTRVNVNVLVPRQASPFPRCGSYGGCGGYSGGSHALPGGGGPGYGGFPGYGGYPGHGYPQYRWAGRCFSKYRWCGPQRCCERRRKYRFFSLSFGFSWGGLNFGFGFRSVRI